MARRRRHTLLPLAAATLATLGGVAVYVWWGLPERAEVRALVRDNPGETSLMRQRAEEARAEDRKPRRLQRWVPLARISRHLIHAVVLKEDAKFFDHEGVDWDEVKESAETNLRRRRLARGGSTLTQQLAKNLFFSTRKDPVRKLRELVVARWLEEDLRKTRLLELYLNVIEWGDGIYGCEAAARTYYGKPAAALTLTEAAGLTAIIPSPRRLNPVVSPERHARAQRRVLALLETDRYVVYRVRKLGADPPDPTPVEEDPIDSAPGEAATPESEAPGESAEPEPEPTALEPAALMDAGPGRDATPPPW
jgi:monofunctional biosynthetic peptidoglycan transglycosylase